ncbi:MAG: glycoside hydrolase [Bacteroidota bacterium]|nr:glycoside hydrolase [Bacteroidota bacterium]
MNPNPLKTTTFFHKHISLRLLFALVLTIASISSYASEIGLGKHEPSKSNITRFVVESSIKYQTIDNFSASDGWSMQFIGVWPKEKQEKMADWLFSTKNDAQGKPKGIGLSLWRFNIGTGSAEQGAASGIDNVWTRTECFLLPNGTYDWEKQKGQRNFLQLAKERGVNQFLGFILSAPVYWTQNGLATNTGRNATFNLKEDHYVDYARFIANVIQGLEKHDGIKLGYVCPFNEPDGHWNWVGSGQEGTAATKSEIAKTVRLMGNEFSMNKIDTKILVSESFDYNCMYRVHPNVKPDRGYQIQSFFRPDSTATYIGNVPNVPRLMAAHSYWTDTPLSDLRKIRMEMGNELKKNNVRYWQTELCIMGNDNEIGGGGGKDLTMKTALYVARVIHHDLVYANASAWQWWRSVGTGDYKDGLIYANPDKTLKDGTFTDSKLMWVLGNYSRFIRPGAIRLGVSAYDNKGKLILEGDTDPYALMISAYENKGNAPVIIVINYGDTERTFELKWKGNVPKGWQPYCTSDEKDFNLQPMTKIKYGKEIIVPARSVITYVGIY